MTLRRVIGFALAALVLTAIIFHRVTAPASVAKLLDAMETAKPDWFPDLDKCPADVMPEREAELYYFPERCANAPEICLIRCRAGNANECYASALIFQEVRHGPVSEALFLRACTLGIASGCTNRAAGMDSDRGSPCAYRTYEMTCDHDDPWGCTMIGMHLLRGLDIAKNPERARQVFSKSCRLDPTSEACKYARQFMREIGD